MWNLQYKTKTKTNRLKHREQTGGRRRGGGRGAGSRWFVVLIWVTGHRSTHVRIQAVHWDLCFL